MAIIVHILLQVYCSKEFNNCLHAYNMELDSKEETVSYEGHQHNGEEAAQVRCGMPCCCRVRHASCDWRFSASGGMGPATTIAYKRSHHACTKERARILWSDAVAQVQSIFQSTTIIHCRNQRLKAVLSIPTFGQASWAGYCRGSNTLYLTLQGLLSLHNNYKRQIIINC